MLGVRTWSWRQISWVCPPSASLRWELEGDSPDLLFLQRTRNLFSFEEDNAFLGLWRCVAWGVCRNWVFARFFEGFCDLLEPSARAGGSGAVWALQSFGVSQSKTSPSASHPH